MKGRPLDDGSYQYPQIERSGRFKETGEKIYVPATLSDDILTGLVRKKYGY